MVALLAWLVATSAHAGRPLPPAVAELAPAPNAAAMPELARLLEATGWMPTPELSGAFLPGRVFLAGDGGHRLQLDGCVDRAPTRSSYTAAELVTVLQAGVGVRVGAFGAEAHGALVKRLKFGAPEQLALPALQLVAAPDCAVALADAARRGVDLDAMYLVQEVLMATIAEQTCGRVDASGRFAVLGQAELDLAAACTQESLEPVAIGYRTLPVAALLGAEVAPPMVASPPVIAAPSPRWRPSPTPAVWVIDR